jgi:hypothetical protein
VPIKYDERVKKPFDELEYTYENVLELSKCSKDINEFIKYVKIIHPDKGEIFFEPYDFQKDLINKFNKFKHNISLCCRQSGKTTVVSVFALHYALFNDNKVIGLVSNKEKSAIMILGRLKRMYEALPSWLKPGVVSYNKTSIEFDNGTEIIVSATSPDAFRGRTINVLIMDELAFVPPNAANDFFASNYPTISASKEGIIIIISTPNGMFNLFHKLYSSAEAKTNTFIPTKVTWREVPGRDDIWAKEQRRNLTEEQFLQEFEVKFIGSTSTVIDANVLEILFNKNKNPIHMDLNDSLYIYEKPIDGATYIIGIDTAKGTKEDYSTMQILKVESSNPVKLKQVAVYNDNTIDVYHFSQIILRTAIYYNKAYLMIENNAEGLAVINQLWWEYEYDNLVNIGKDIGIRATKSTKPKAVILMKKLIEENQLEIFDIETIRQLTDFKEIRKNIFSGVNLHDDLVTSLYWACYIFELDILDEKIKFREENTEEGWGILFDVNEEVDWSWLTDESITRFF